MLVITEPPNGPVLFCWLASVVVVCNAAGGPAGRRARGNAAWERCRQAGLAGRMDGRCAGSRLAGGLISDVKMFMIS